VLSGPLRTIRTCLQRIPNFKLGSKADSPPTVGGEEADARCHNPPTTKYHTLLLKVVADNYLRRTAIIRPILTTE
jgi:hypothetical protein